MFGISTSTALLGLAVLAVAGLRPARVVAQTPAEMKLTLSVGGRTQTLRGMGLCGHEPKAWIWGKAARLWTADFRQAAATQVSLTYWRPAAAGQADLFSLSVHNGRKQHFINTTGSRPVGTGRSTFQPTGFGGRFDVTGSTAEKTPVHVTIECARFGTIAAEGG